jgi:uncharacterized protein (TIGR03083 family)
MVSLPGEAALRTERRAFLATITGLTPNEFASAPTLCEGWAPRDVLAHLLGIDDAPAEYLRAAGRVGTANARIVEAARRSSRAELLQRAERWAARLAPHARAGAFFFLGDLGVHHSDVLRGIGGRHLEVPPAVGAAILREGIVLGANRALRYRVKPDGGHAIGLPGRPTVRGTPEALGMWLAGRASVAAELQFDGSA